MTIDLDLIGPPLRTIMGRYLDSTRRVLLAVAVTTSLAPAPADGLQSD